jgi:hypothetical protein
VKLDGKALIVYHPQTDATLHTFYGDARFSRTKPVVLDGGHVVVVGDSLGRVLFLRVRDGEA